MITVAALALAGLHAHATAEPWVNQLMGVSRSEAEGQLKKEEDGGFFTSKDEAMLVEVMGSPTSFVWVMRAEDEGEEEFSFQKLLSDLGFDGEKVEHTVWTHDEVDTPIIKSLPGLKKGWVPFVGAYDMLFVGPEVAADFDQTGEGIKADQYAKGFADFLKDPTWKGAFKTYGKAQHIELFDQSYYLITWKGQGAVIEEVGLNMDFSMTPEGKDATRDMRTNPEYVSELGYTFYKGVKDWKEAFRAIGLDAEGVTAERDDEEEDIEFYKNVKGLPKGWVVYMQYHEGDAYYLSISGAGPEEEPRRR